MQELNFLPAEYHQAAVKRQGKLWHLVVIVLFGGMVSVATLLQVSARSRVETELVEVEPQYQAAMQARDDLAKVQAELKQVGASAQLCVYLEGHWPMTQILTSAIEGVPDSVRLTQLHYTNQNSNDRAGLAGRQPVLRGEAARQAEAASENLLEAQRDLIALQASRANQQTVVFLEGLTANSADLHTYTSLLAQQPLLAKAELLSLEESQRGTGAISTFRLRLVVRPISGLPTATPPASTTASLTGMLP